MSKFSAYRGIMLLLRRKVCINVTFFLPKDGRYNIKGGMYYDTAD